MPTATVPTQDLAAPMRDLFAAAATRTQHIEALDAVILQHLRPAVAAVREADAEFEQALHQAWAIAFAHEGDERSTRLTAISDALQQLTRYRYAHEIGGAAGFVGYRIGELKLTGQIGNEE